MVWGQRKCRWPGEYAPELLEAIDENTDEDNQDLIDNVYKKYINSDEFVSIQIIESRIDDKTLFEALKPNKFIPLKNIKLI